MNLKVEDYFQTGKRSMIRFSEKGGKETKIPVHHKLEELLDQYLETSGLRNRLNSPLFPIALGKTRKLGNRPATRIDAARMLKRRLRDDRRSRPLAVFGGGCLRHRARHGCRRWPNGVARCVTKRDAVTGELDGLSPTSRSAGNSTPQASIEQLTGLLPAHLQVAGNDMLRDEGVKKWPMRVNSMQPGWRSPGALCRHDPRLRICELSQPDPDRPHSPALGRRGIKKTPQIKFRITSGDRTVFENVGTEEFFNNPRAHSREVPRSVADRSFPAR